MTACKSKWCNSNPYCILVMILYLASLHYVTNTLMIKYCESESNNPVKISYI